MFSRYIFFGISHSVSCSPFLAMYVSMLSLFVIEFLHSVYVHSFALPLDSSSVGFPGIPNGSQDTVEGSVGGSNVQDQSESSNDLRDSSGSTRYLQALTTSNLDELSNLEKAPDSSSSTGSMFSPASFRDSTGSIKNFQFSTTSKSNELALLNISPQTGSLPNSKPSSDESQAAFDAQNAIHPLSLSNNPKGVSDSPGGEIPAGTGMVIGDKDLPSSNDNSNQKQLDFVIPKEVIEAAPEGARTPKPSTPKSPGVAAPDGDTVVDPLDWTHVPKNPVIDDEETTFTEEDIANEKEDRDDQPPDCTRMTKNNFRTAMCCQEGAPPLQGKPSELHPLKTTRRGKCNLCKYQAKFLFLLSHILNRC